jgi:hypothetical protein
VTADGLVLREIAPGVSVAELRALTGAPLAEGSDIKEIVTDPATPAALATGSTHAG